MGKLNYTTAIINQWLSEIPMFENYTQSDGTLKRYTSGSLNNIASSGRYYVTSACTELPYTGASGYLDVYVYDNARIYQIFFSFEDDRIFERKLARGVWSSWEQLITKSALDSLLPSDRTTDYVAVPAGTIAVNGQTTFTISRDETGIPYSANVFTISNTSAFPAGLVPQYIGWSNILTRTSIEIRLMNLSGSAMSITENTVKIKISWA